MRGRKIVFRLILVGAIYFYGVMGLGGQKELEDEISGLKQENLRLRQELAELSSKLELLLSRISELEKEVKELKDRNLVSGGSLKEEDLGATVIKIKPEAKNPAPVIKSEDKTIIIIDEDKKQAPDKKGAEKAQGVIEEVKKLLAEKKYGEAENLIKSGLKEKPSALVSCQLQFYFGECLVFSGKNLEGAKAYLGVGERYPVCELAPEAMFKAGEIYERAGDKKQGKKVFKELISLYPFSKYANLAKERIGE